MLFRFLVLRMILHLVLSLHLVLVVLVKVNLDAAGFCSDKMSEFMDEYQQAKYKDGVNYRHMVPPLYGLLDQFSHVFSSPHILFQYCFKIQVSLRLMGLHHLYQEILDVDKTDLSVEEQIH